MARTTTETICGHRITVHPDVFNPAIFRSGRIFAEYLRATLPDAGSNTRLKILDLGTGSGILAVVCASAGHDVVATDLNPAAVQCARQNFAAIPEGRRPVVFEGDVFAPVSGRRFDLVLWNPPFFEGEPATLFDLSWRSDHGIERFASGLAEHLVPGGRALLIWSSHAREALLTDALSHHELSARLLKSSPQLLETFAIYEIKPNFPRVPHSMAIS